MNWIEIKQQQPAKGIVVLISDGNIVTTGEPIYHHTPEEFGGFNPHGVWGYECEWNFNDNKFTHWALLPEPPKIEV